MDTTRSMNEGKSEGCEEFQVKLAENQPTQNHNIRLLWWIHFRKYWSMRNSICRQIP